MNFLLTLAYDGTNYCGFQVQPNGRSVAETFQDGLEAVLGTRPDIKGTVLLHIIRHICYVYSKYIIVAIHV